MSMNLLSVIGLIVGLLLIRKTSNRRAIFVLAGVLSFIYFFLSSIYLVSDWLTGNGFDESVLFHLETGLGGAGIEDFQKVIWLSVFLIAGSVVLAFFVYRFLAKKSLKTQDKKKTLMVAIVILAIAVFTHPVILSTVRMSGESNSDEFTRVFWKPEFEEKPKSSPNLVFIYLESFERTYSDEKIFPGLINNLRDLEARSISFTDIDDAWGTGWTMAGMTASQCASPLVTTGSGRNSMYGMRKFYPNAVCLGDILERSGYDLTFMGGAHLKFAGKGNFYTTHGFSRVLGREELRQNLADQSYMSSWGLYDDSLFDLAWQEYLTLSASDQPFGLFMLTLDTHHPDGYASSPCKLRDFADQGNTMLEAVACTDYLVGNFIQRIESSKAAGNTLIVVLSDHLSMPNKVRDLLDSGRRKNLFLMRQKGITTPQSLSKMGTTLDVAPTVLSLMGFANSGFGFGRNLFESDPTLRESSSNFNSLLRSAKTDIQQFWSFPSLDKVLRVIPEEKILKIGAETFELPALFKLEKTLDKSKTEILKIKEIFFDDFWDVDLTNSLSSFTDDDLFLWIDECQKISFITENLTDEANSKFCLVAGKLGRERQFHTTIQGTQELLVSKILPDEGEELSQSLYLAQLASLQIKQPVSVGKKRLEKLSESKKSLEGNISAEGYLDLSLQYYQIGQFENTIAAAQKAIEIKPDYVTAYSNICAAHNELSQPDKAIVACEKALEIQPDFSLAKGNLNWARKLQNSE